ncbi:ATP-grasp domain-containing protein [Novipirellula sp. SH528]|uniref:ATP-grasp domain-containing protein n=1 Tax=Novipirellula sp. SH528 TaxID=3454466 RepID=UPI003FA0C929
MNNCNSRPTVTLVGASVRAAAQSATRAGFSVIGFDLFGDSDCQAACDQFVLIRDQDDLAKKIETQATRFLSQFTSPPVPPPILFVGGFSGDVCPLPHARSLLTRNLKALPFLVELATAIGIHFPATLRATEESTRDIAQRTKSRAMSRGERWLCKDFSSSGGVHVRWVTNKSHAQLQSDSDSIFYQRWVAGKRFGVSYLSDGKESVMLGVCRSLHTRKPPYPFVHGGSYGPVFLSEKQTETLRELGDTLVTKTALAGLFGIDVIIDAHKYLWLLEINPRWTASSELIERDLIRRNVLGSRESLIGSACRIQFPNTSREWNSPSLAELKMRLSESDEVANPFLKKVVFARQTGKFDRAALSHAEINGIQCYDIPHDATSVSKGQPLCSLIGPTEALSQATSEMRLRNSVRLAQMSIR